MKEWSETTTAVVFYIIALILALSISFGFYYLIFILAKKVFFS